MKRRILLILSSALIFTACGSELDFDLTLLDPCNQAVLTDASSNIAHIEFSVVAPEISGATGTVWSASDHEGVLTGLPPVSDAIVSITGRAPNASGSPGEALARGAVGLVDLSGADGNEVSLPIVLGRVRSFYRTTDVEGAATTCTTQVAARKGHSATLLKDGRVFIAGGVMLRPADSTIRYWETTEFYEPASGRFVSGPSMSWVREAHTATLLKDGRVFLAGGVGLNGDTIDTWKVALIFDPDSHRFNNPVAMQEQRANHTATLLADGRVLLAGGTFNDRELQTTEIFDPETNTTCLGPALSEPRSHHSAVLVGPSQVVIVGGRGSGRVLSGVEVISVGACGTGASTRLTQGLSQGRSHVAAAKIVGTSAILVAGGFGGVVSSPDVGTGLNSIEIIQIDSVNPASSTLSCSNLTLIQGRGAMGITALPDGGMLIAGGAGNAGEPLGTAEIIHFGDLSSCQASIEFASNSMSGARVSPVFTQLLGGDILITGGTIRNLSSQVESSDFGEIFVSPR